MLSQQQCLAAFHRYAAGADVCVVEGVMVRTAGWRCALASARGGSAVCIVISAGLPARVAGIFAHGAAVTKQTLFACLRSKYFAACGRRTSDHASAENGVGDCAGAV